MTHQRIVSTAATLLLAAACSDKIAIARNDSLQTELNEQQQLATKLSSQKDSLTRIVVDADAFLGKMDSAITSGKKEVGSGKRKNIENEPLVSILLVAEAAIGVLFSVWLTYLELAVIHAICIWCVTSAGIVVAILVVSIADLGELRAPPAMPRA